MTADVILNILSVTIWPPACPLIVRGIFSVLKITGRNPAAACFLRGWPGFCWGWMTAAIGTDIGCAGSESWIPWLLLSLANTSVAVFFWWLSRRRRRRAPKSHGAKSRARLAALVRKAREAARSRRVAVPDAAPVGFVVVPSPDRTASPASV